MTFHELKPTLQPPVKIRRRHLTHLLGGHRQRNEGRDSVDGVEINLLEPLFIATCHVRSPTFGSRSFRRLERRQLHDFAGFWIHHRLIPRSTHTVRSNCNRRHIDHLLRCSGLPSQLFDSKIEENIGPVIKERREAGEHRSSTPRLGSQPSLSVLRVTCRNPRVFGLPHYAFGAFAVRLRSLSPSAPLGATPTATAHTRSSAPTASCSALIWWANSETSPACRRTPPAPRLWGSLPRLCIPSNAHPHVF